MDFATLIQPSYWLTIQPPQVVGGLGSFVFGFFVLCFVVGIVSRIVASNRSQDRYIEELGKRVGALFVTMGLIGILLFFFSFERIQFFGGRFWYPLWLIGTIVWAYFIFRFAKNDIPKMRNRDMRRRAVNKYMPARKKKKKKKR